MTVPSRSRGAALVRAPHSYAARHVVLPMQRFLSMEISSGAVLLLAAAVALIWANSPWAGSYESLWQTEVSFRAGEFLLVHDLREWINDAVMVVFFFVVGLEVKREFVAGELADLRRAALPVAAAAGGMLVPALLYLSRNAGESTVRGWGIPMATDIAFALGVLALAGDRVPAAARIFLLVLATVDDIGAILVIAVAYTQHVSAAPLFAALFLAAVIIGMRRFGIHNLLYYVPVGVLFWFAVLESGVHPTIAGVVLGLLTPTAPVFSRASFSEAADESIRRFHQAEADGDREAADAGLGELDQLTSGTESPADRLIRLLHPWSSFVVLPLFAFANAGIALSLRSAAQAMSSAVTQGIVIGLLLGKTIGITLFAWVAVRTGLARLPSGVRPGHLVGIGLLGGIGFTVSMFISDLAFDDPAIVGEAKIGILAASLLASIAGYCFLRLSRKVPPSGDLLTRPGN